MIFLRRVASIGHSVPYLRLSSCQAQAVNSKLSRGWRVGWGCIYQCTTLGGIIVWFAECHSDSDRSTKFVIAMAALRRSKGRLIRFIVSVQMRPRTKGTMSKANWYVLNYRVPYYTLEFVRIFRRTDAYDAVLRFT